MATFGNEERVTVVAGEDLTSAQFKFVTLESDGQIDLADAIGETAYGVLKNNPDTGGAATVVLRGTTMIIAGGAVTAGETVCTDASGDAIHTADSTSATTRHMGIALEDAVDGQVFRVELFGPYAGDITDES